MKYKYSVEQNTPLKFYKFLCKVLPVIFILNIISFAFTLVVSLSDVSMLSPLYISYLLSILCTIVFLFLSFKNLRTKNWSGVIFFNLYTVGFYSQLFLQSYLLGRDDIYRILCIALLLIVLFLYWIYFKKRRLLFLPRPADYMSFYASAPNPVANSTTDSSDPSPTESIPEIKQPVSPASHFSGRIKTYVECPACGLMVPKGQPTCDCGYDLIPPSKKFFKKFFRIFVPVVLCVGIAAGGFFVGRYSMQSEVEAARESGYDKGFSAGNIAGYNRGRTEGYNRGLEIGKERGFEEGLASTSRVYYVNGNNIYHESINCTLFPAGQIKISTAYESRNLGKRPCIFCCSK